VLPICNQSFCPAAMVPTENRGDNMAERISPKFHAEIIVVLFDEYQDHREVMQRVQILLSDASAEHIEAVGKFLPIDLVRVLPRRMQRAA
jgi:hypothetical protein